MSRVEREGMARALAVLLGLWGLVVPASAEPLPGGLVTSVFYQFAPGGPSTPTGPVLLLEGAELLFVNADVLDHSVTAVAEDDTPPAFDSGVVAPAGVAAVSGTASLPAGDYPFVCSLHPRLMTGELRVIPRPA